MPKNGLVRCSLVGGAGARAFLEMIDLPLKHEVLHFQRPAKEDFTLETESKDMVCSAVRTTCGMTCKGECSSFHPG